VNLMRFISAHSLGKTRTRVLPKSTFYAGVGAAMLITLFLETSELMLLCCGAMIYAMCTCTLRVPRKLPNEDEKLHVCHPTSSTRPKIPKHPPVQTITGSVKPVKAPHFQSTGWDAEVKELLGWVIPSTESQETANKVAECMKRVLLLQFPDAEVTGYAGGNPAESAAFRVAVPDTEIVLSMETSSLRQASHERLSQGHMAGALFDNRKLSKMALRSSTDLLVGGGFKFRRSAFTAPEPKVTLLAPMGLNGIKDAVAVEFGVNSTSAPRCAALLACCDKCEPRFRELFFLVKRWARDRGVSHVAKGHLSPYAWSLLVAYFMQVGTQDGKPLLPPLDDLQCKPQFPNMQASSSELKSVGTLFKEFVSFYHAFAWNKEGVSVRLSRRTNMWSLPMHIEQRDTCSIYEVALSVEDPFELSNNLASHVSACTFQRLQEEFARAAKLCACSTSSLTDLLEPWAPNDDTQATLPCKRSERESESKPPWRRATKLTERSAVDLRPSWSTTEGSH